MFNPTANIYVSIGQAARRDSDQSSDSRYHRRKHTYLISVEPHHVKIPGLPTQEPTVTHFEAINNISSGSSGIVRYTSKTSPGIIGNILIAQSARTTVEKVHKILSEKLASSSWTNDSFADDEDEHLIRLLLRVLREHDLIATFNIEEFIMWTHSYVADRLNNEAPSLVAYPRAHRDPETQTKRRSWSIGSLQKRSRSDSKVGYGDTM